MKVMLDCFLIDIDYLIWLLSLSISTNFIYYIYYSYVVSNYFNLF